MNSDTILLTIGIGGILLFVLGVIFYFIINILNLLKIKLPKALQMNTSPKKETTQEPIEEILRKFLNNKDDKGWGAIASKIIDGLKLARNDTFKQYVRTIQDAINNGKSTNKVRNATLSGDAELAMMAYQLYYVTGFIAERVYLQPAQGREFSDLLYQKMCGPKLNDCLTFLARYDTPDFTTQTSRLCYDVAKYITNSQAIPVEMVLMYPIALSDTVITKVAVANAFGDDATVKELMSKMSQLL